MSRFLACVAALSYATIMMTTFGLLALVMIFSAIKLAAEGLTIFGVLEANWPMDHLTLMAWIALALSALPACYMSYWLGLKVYRYEISPPEASVDSDDGDTVTPFTPKPRRPINIPYKRAA
jgi:hypothetical protein